MRTQKAAIIILSILLVSSIAIGFKTDLMSITGFAESDRPSYIPGPIDFSGAAKAVGDFGGVDASDWFMVPMTILIITLLVFLTLKNGVFSKISGAGAGGQVEDVVIAVIAISFGTLAVYKTSIAIWVTGVGFYGVIALLIGIAVYLAFGSYTKGRALFGDLWQEHREGVSARRNALQDAERDIAGVRREGYLAQEDIDIIGQMRGIEGDIERIDKDLVVAGERIRELFMQGLRSLGNQPYFGKGAQAARQELKEIYHNSQWINKVSEILAKYDNKYDKLKSKLNKITREEIAIARFIYGTDRRLLADEIKIEHIANHEKYKKEHQTALGSERLAINETQIVQDINQYLKKVRKAETVLDKIEAKKKAIRREIRGASKTFVQIENALDKAAGRRKNMGYLFQKGVAAANEIIKNARALAEEDRETETELLLLGDLEEKIRELDTLALTKLIQTNGLLKEDSSRSRIRGRVRPQGITPVFY